MSSHTACLNHRQISSNIGKSLQIGCLLHKYRESTHRQFGNNKHTIRQLTLLVNEEIHSWKFPISSLKSKHNFKEIWRWYSIEDCLHSKPNHSFGSSLSRNGEEVEGWDLWHHVILQSTEKSAWLHTISSFLCLEASLRAHTQKVQPTLMSKDAAPPRQEGKVWYRCREHWCLCVNAMHPLMQGR